MAEIVTLQERRSDRLHHLTTRRDDRVGPAEGGARILFFTGVRYVRDEPFLTGAAVLTGQRPVQDFHPSEG